MEGKDLSKSLKALEVKVKKLEGGNVETADAAILIDEAVRLAAECGE